MIFTNGCERRKQTKEKMWTEQCVRCLKALANPMRLTVLDAIGDDEKSVTEICDAAELKQSSVSFQLRILRDSGIIASRKAGQNVYYKVVMPIVFDVIGIIKKEAALK